MKKLCAAVALLAMVSLVVPPAAMADSKGASCGVGKVVMDGKSGKDAHVVAVVIDFAISAVLGSLVTFGMTSGTLGCNPEATIQIDQLQEEFVAQNYNNLAEDMAQGRGQYLDAMAALVGCSGEAVTSFSRMGQEKYEVLFSEQAQDARTWLNGLKGEMRKDNRLAVACSVS